MASRRAAIEAKRKELLARKATSAAPDEALLPSVGAGSSDSNAQKRAELERRRRELAARPRLEDGPQPFRGKQRQPQDRAAASGQLPSKCCPLLLLCGPFSSALINSRLGASVATCRSSATARPQPARVCRRYAVQGNRGRAIDHLAHLSFFCDPGYRQLLCVVTTLVSATAAVALVMTSNVPHTLRGAGGCVWG